MIDISKEFLVEELINKKRKKSDLARELSVSVHTINRMCKTHGVVVPQRFYGKIMDLTGIKYGRLLVVEKAGVDKFGKTLWLCQCDCGNTKTINAASLIKNLTGSCGCLKRELAHKGYKDISKQHWRRMEDGAEKRNLEFNIQPEDVWEIYENQNRKCLLTGLDINFYPDYNQSHKITASIDRIDSSRGYFKNNICLVHKIVNLLKKHLSNEEFIAWCKLVSNNNEMSEENIIKYSSRVTYQKAIRNYDKTFEDHGEKMENE